MLSGGLGLVETSIKDWVRRNVCLIDAEKGRCHKLVIRHLTVEKKPDADVHTITIPGDPSMEGTEIADKVIIDIAQAAQRDANDLGGLQVYAVYAYYAADKNWVPRKIFRVAAEDEIEREREGVSEPPTEKGLLSQLMRHNETNIKTSLVGMGYILQTFQKEIQAQREQNRIFMNQQIDMTILVQEVLDGASKRRIEERGAEIQTSVIEGVFEHLKVGLPIIFNRLAGKEVFPAKMERELYMLASLLEGLAPEQQAELSNMLRPEQLSVLAELLGMYEERKHKFLTKHGEDTEEKNDNASSKKPENKTKKIGSGTGSLLKMFEKRKTLVNGEKVGEMDDQRARRIEQKAANIRDRLKDVQTTLRGDGNDER